ncbi:hypothetical protein [Verrucosispora sp. WMMC514]|uniref:hypothetical protein n=1 Tax=Verrucosispora sp. WMMC514 TaxID=3015156 RepID=UPI00248B7197|nr:hypothetical protein [Verrucosispora sp. WMMC514]WBB94179.1 hypothetical protein O7597_15120 [Verrucosispora sp. WMMC514]
MGAGHLGSPLRSPRLHGTQLLDGVGDTHQAERTHAEPGERRDGGGADPRDGGSGPGGDGDQRRDARGNERNQAVHMAVGGADAVAEADRETVTGTPAGLVRPGNGLPVQAVPEPTARISASGHEPAPGVPQPGRRLAGEPVSERRARIGAGGLETAAPVTDPAGGLTDDVVAELPPGLVAGPVGDGLGLTAHPGERARQPAADGLGERVGEDVPRPVPGLLGFPGDVTPEPGRIGTNPDERLRKRRGHRPPPPGSRDSDGPPQALVGGVPALKRRVQPGVELVEGFLPFLAVTHREGCDKVTAQPRVGDVAQQPQTQPVERACSSSVIDTSSP